MTLMMASRMGAAARSFRVVSHLSSMQSPTPLSVRQLSMDAKGFASRLVDAGLLRSQALIGGKWSDAYDGKTIEVHNPATGDVITTVPCMGQNETNDAISAAYNAFSLWSKVTSVERSKCLRKWYDLLISHKEELGQLITLEQGKPLQEAMGEVTYGAGFIEFFAEEAKRVYGDIIPSQKKTKPLFHKIFRDTKLGRERELGKRFRVNTLLEKADNFGLDFLICSLGFSFFPNQGGMEISMLKALLNSSSSFFHFSSHENINVDPVQKYYQKAEEILKLLKTVLDAIVGSEIASYEVLNKPFEELGHYLEELREQFQDWQPLSSKVKLVLQVESLISKISTCSLDVFQLLKTSEQHLPDELGSASLELCIQKLKHMSYEKTSTVIKDAISDLVEGVGPSSEILVKIAEGLSLRSNQEILIEAVALEKLKENAEQSEKIEEAEYIEHMIALMTRMHERLITIKQSESCSTVPIPADFCCPLSLELMTDPVIVASGQTYERTFIKNWINLGLTVCPKTRQTLAHTNLIPNYTVKALIANWCESNNVKLPDPTKSMDLNKPTHLLGHAEPGVPKDSPIHPRSRVNPSMSPDSTRSMGSPTKNFISSGGVHRGGSSPFHPRSASEGSLYGVAGNGQVLDVARVSSTNSEDRSAIIDDRTTGLVSQQSTSPSRSEFPITTEANQLLQSHNRSASASSILSNTNGPRETALDANGSLQTSGNLSGYSSDASGEFKSEQQAATPQQREPELPTRMPEARPHNPMWRRPSGSLIPRMVSNPPTETRPDLSGLEAQVRTLVEDLKSTTLDSQRDATYELRMLAKHNMDNRIVIANCGAISLLVELLRSTDSRVQENSVTALLNLSINDNNKTAIATANAIEPLIYVLETGSAEAKENSAATLFSLSVIEDNKVRIGRAGAIGPLVDLLGNGTPRGRKDAATALFNLSIFHENKARIVQADAVKYLVELMDPAAGMVDKAVAVLANLSTIPEGRTAIGQEGGIPVLVEVVELGSARGKENAAAALLQLCTNSNRYCSIVLQEGAVPPLVVLSQSGTPRAKEKAQTLLSYFRNHRNAGRG